MRIAVCDDDRLMLDQAASEISREMRRFRNRFVLDKYLSAVLFREQFEKEPYDIVILDIMMPKVDGFTLAEDIRRLREDTIIIFLSQQEDLVFRSFDYRPYWFLPKENFREKLPHVINRLIPEYESRSVYIDVGREQSRPVKKDKVFYIECCAHKLFVKLDGEVICRYGSLSKLENQLSDQGFLRIHKNYLVNVDKVQYVEKDSAVLENGERIALSKYKREALKERLFKSGN